MKVDPGIRALKLLTKNDPPPVEILNPHSDHPLLLICEHAGQAIPERLGGLGISRADLNTHIGWDIGAKAVTQAMAHALGAPAVFQRYSRLVIDCNRPPDASDAMPMVSDGVDIPGNQGLGLNARDARRQEIFDPFHDAVATCFAQHPRRMVLSIHSFTPAMDGISRPWDIGFLFRKDTETSRYLERFVREAQPHLIIGMNQPYQIDDRSDWFVPHHGEARRIPHSLIEIRNDLIQEPEGQIEWANTLVDAATRYLEEI
jgi:predicted N-formylglutamate amidohydrolase